MQFKFSLMNPLSTCVIYSETFPSVDLSSSSGSVVLALGAGTRSYPLAGGMQWYDAFNNATASYTCQVANGPPPTYSPGLTSNRRLVMQFNDGSVNGWQTLPPMDINSVPYAMFAELAETVPITGLLQGGATPGQVLKWTGTSWAASTDNSNASGVSNVSSATSYLSVANGGTAPVLTINVGTGINTVAAGNDARITGAFQSATSLSGDLTGTLPNAVIAAGAVTNAKITSMAFSKLTGVPTTLVGHGITMTSSDITTALTYTPTISQWVTNASSDITYTGGNVGIGTTAPQSMLNVAGNATIGSTSIAGQPNGLYVHGNSGVGNVTANSKMSIWDNPYGWGMTNDELLSMQGFPGFGSGFKYGIRGNLTNTSGFSGPMTGISFDVSSNSTASGQAFGISGAVTSANAATYGAGIAGSYRLASTGSYTLVYPSFLAGGSFSFSGSATGTATEGHGIISQISQDPGGSLTSAYAGRFVIRNGGGTITNGYGVYIDPVNATQKWGIYQAGASDSNYFAGNVGIGTTAPSGQLHVRAPTDGATNGGFIFAPTNFNSGTPSVVQSYQNGNSTQGIDLLSYDLGTGNIKAGSQLRNDGTIRFLTGSAGAATEKFRIDSNGNVGIGTASPGYALSVVGDVNVTGAFRVNGSVIGGGSGTVTSATAAATSGNPITVSASSTSPSIDISRATASVNGYLAASDFSIFLAKGSGSVTGATAAATSGNPITVSASSASPSIDISRATASVNGYLASSDFSIFAAKGSGSVTSATAASTSGNPITVSASSTSPSIDISRATASVNGYLASSDFSIFAAKGSGSVTSATAASTSGNPITVSASSTSPSIDISRATASVNGYLASSDFSIFNAKGSGSVTSATAAATSGNPITVSASSTSPSIDISRATALVNGYLASSDFSIFAAKGSGSVTSATAAATSGNPITVSASSTSPSIDISRATALVNGYLASSDFSIFNAKGSGSVTGATSALTTGNPITVSASSTSPSIDISKATASVNGYLSSADFTTFNNKGSVNGATAAATSGNPITVSASSTSPSIDISRATASVNGYLASSDFSIFLAKGSGSVTGATSALTTGNPITVSASSTSPSIDISRATASVNGYLASSDFSIFASKGSGSVTSATAASTSGNPITVSASSTSPSIDISRATASVNGYLASSDFTTFNNKVSSQWVTNGSGDISRSSGNVGIGTTTPAFPLSVAGIIHSSSGGFKFPDGTIQATAASGAGVAGPSFYVNKNGVNQTVTAGVTTKLTGWSKVVSNTFDTNSNFAADRFLPTVAGKYLITGSAYCFPTNGSYCIVEIRKNGAIVSANYQYSSTDASPISSAVVDMNGTTDYIELYAQNGAYTTIGGTNQYTYFMGSLLAPLASGSVAGTGTAGYLPVWSSSTNLTNSPIAVLAGNVGIGTANPYTKLFVANGEQFIDYGTGGVTNGGALRLATNANEAFIGSNHYYNVSSKYARAGGASYINFDITTTATAGDITFNTAPSGSADGVVTFTPNVTFKQSGNVGVGTINPLATLEVNGGGGINVAPSILRNTTVAGGNYWKVGPDGNNNFIIYTQANAGVWMSAGATSWSAGSDSRIKKAIRPVEDGLSKVMQLNGVTYLYRSEDDQAARHAGVIAQDVLKVLPEAVSEKDGFLGVKYTELIPLLIEGIKGLYAQWSADSSLIHRNLASLKDQNKQLENENIATKTQLKEASEILNKLREDNKNLQEWVCTKDPAAPFCKN
ncbi:MAG: tail fiber domain-containing protein [Bdellovibrio sp.]|nr:tail fiber domain-containing protein [Bdellovibrio sp.]